MLTEVLNQEPTSTNDIADDFNDDEDLFADFEFEEESKPTETEEVEEKPVVDEQKEEEVKENTDPQVASPQDQPSFLQIKYNKEAKNLTKEEAITLAQKGMNYDEIHSRYESLKANEGTFNEISRLAAANGITVAEYVKNLSDVQEQFEFNKEVEALRQKYPNSDEEALQELAKAHLANNANVVSRKKEEEANVRREQINRQIDIFKKRHPNLDYTKLDKSVYALMNEGYTLLEAYETFNADKIEAEEQKRISLEKSKEQNQINKSRSLGSTSNQGYEEEDEFVKELFAD